MNINQARVIVFQHSKAEALAEEVGKPLPASANRRAAAARRFIESYEEAELARQRKANAAADWDE